VRVFVSVLNVLLPVSKVSVFDVVVDCYPSDMCKHALSMLPKRYVYVENQAFSTYMYASTKKKHDLFRPAHARSRKAQSMCVPSESSLHVQVIIANVIHISMIHVLSLFFGSKSTQVRVCPCMRECAVTCCEAETDSDLDLGKFIHFYRRIS
jgi:hypothetical protein